jgi:RNase P subunit RPR2
MIGKASFTFGKSRYDLEIEEKDEMDMLHRLIVLSNPPTYCTNCKTNDKVQFDTNKDKEGNTYINVRCWNCNAKAKLGKYKAGGFFWHKFELYQKPGAQSAQTPVADSKSQEDMPF